MSAASEQLMAEWKPGMLAECVDAGGADVLDLGQTYRIRSVEVVPFGQGERKVGIRLEGVVRPDYVNGEGETFSDYPFGAKRFRPVPEREG